MSRDSMNAAYGIYRSILDKDNLRADEEIVRFANFSISEVMPVNGM